MVTRPKIRLLRYLIPVIIVLALLFCFCLLYTSDAADE